MNISSDHPLCDIKTQVEQLCKPLFSHTPFHYFDYQQYHFDGNYIALSIDSNFFCEMVNKKLLPSLDELQQNTSHYVCYTMSGFTPEMVIHQNKFTENIDLAKNFKIAHRLYLGFSTSQYMEAFGFGLDNSKKDVFNIFMNYTSLLEKFCVYFRESAEELIEQADKSKIKIYDSIEPSVFHDFNFKNDNSYVNFLNDIKLKKYRMKGRSGKCYLSTREFECLYWATRGKTAKEIAKLLSLSPRTVEVHFVNIKNKMGCESKIELVELAMKNPIIKSFS